MSLIEITAQTAAQKSLLSALFENVRYIDRHIRQKDRLDIVTPYRGVWLNEWCHESCINTVMTIISNHAMNNFCYQDILDRVN